MVRTKTTKNKNVTSRKKKISMSKEARESRLRSRFESTFKDADFKMYTNDEIRYNLKARFYRTMPSLEGRDMEEHYHKLAKIRKRFAEEKASLQWTVNGNIDESFDAYFGVKTPYCPCPGPDCEDKADFPVFDAYFGVKNADPCAEAENDFLGFDGSLLDTIVVRSGQRRDIEEHYRKLAKIQQQFAEEKARINCNPKFVPLFKARQLFDEKIEFKM
jgi:hypothetical protein